MSESLKRKALFNAQGDTDVRRNNHATAPA